MDTQKSPRRTTRLSASSTNHPEATVVYNSHLTLDDLVFGDETISSDELLATLAGRRQQTLDLLCHIGPLNSPLLPLFVYGGAATGKTSTVLQVFKHLNRPFVYSSCRTCYNPKILFESVLNQLMLHTRSSTNGYSSFKRCEKPSDFVNFLKEVLVSVVKNLKENLSKKGSKTSGEHAKGSMVYLIFDNLELVREWDKSSTMLSFLFRLYRILNMTEVGVIFVSNASPDVYYSNAGSMDLFPLHFPDYSEDELRTIFMKSQGNSKLYSSFLSIVLKPYSRVTRRVDELSTAFLPLFQKYCEPLKDSGTALNEELKRKLFTHLQPHISSSLNEVFHAPTHSAGNFLMDKEKLRRKNSSKRLGATERVDEMDFHMSASAKYLLISAFLASRNPATLDASLFDSTGGTDSRKKRRKMSEKTKEMKENAEQELLLKGPGTFPLERLLAIFQCITSMSEDSLNEDQDENIRFEAGADSRLMADVLLQLSSLCNANFISKGGSCPLESSTRYRSLVSEDMTLKVARSLNFPLSKYLYRR
uniref:Origin recognition complex subunit 5 n=1 Tax=Kalanchoe fedtschenkoi TaxID=63787 RepID=A0A7N0TH44_KALFE